jgi:hypothetical protein
MKPENPNYLPVERPQTLPAENRKPVGKSHFDMHKDHIVWDSDCKIWLEDLDKWDFEIDEIQKNLKAVRRYLKYHNKSLKKHRETIMAHKEKEVSHEAMLSALEEHSPVDEAMAMDHQAETRFHFLQKDAHERLKKYHHQIAALTAGLKKAIESAI